MAKLERNGNTMDSKGKILKFASYSQKQLEQMKQDLSISMPLSFLRHCASYYKTHAKRDPAIDELKLLDRYTMAGINDLRFVAPTELQSNDSAVAETYADMMKKRHELFPDAKIPMSLEEGLGLATGYLARAGKAPAFGTLLTLSKKQADSTTIGANALVSENGFMLACLDACPLPAQSNDLFALLLPEDGGFSSAKYSTLLDALLVDPAFGKKVKSLRILGNGGVLEALLKETDGAWIDLARLSITGNEVPLAHLVDAFTTMALVRIPRESEKEVFYLSKAHGIRSLIFATATDGSTYTIRRDTTEALTLDVLFLRSFHALTPMKIALQNEADGTPVTPSQSPITQRQCKYLDLPKPEAASHALLHGSQLCAPASATLESAPFTNAFYTALTAVTNLVLSGVPYPEQELAIGLSCGTAERERSQAAASALSSILGIYRLQAELGIRSSEIALREDASGNTTELAVFARAASGSPCPVFFQEHLSTVYCMAPKLRPDGLPNSNSLKALLGQLSALREQGNLLSATVLRGQTVTEMLLQMETEEYDCHLQNERIATGEPLPFAVLVETPNTLPYGSFVGSVKCKDNSCDVLRSSPRCNPVRLAPFHSLIWSETPEIVLLAAGGDTNACALASQLTQNGAKVHAFVTDDPDALKLSRALLQSQTLILCQNASLPHTPQIQFALQTLRHAGGRVLTLGTTSAKMQGAIHLPSGLTPEHLSVLCEKEVSL